MKYYQKLLTFTKDTNLQLIKALQDIENEKCISLMSHILNAQHIWNHRILEKPSQFTVWQILPKENWESLNHQNFQQSINILRDQDLKRLIHYTSSSGESYTSSIEDILFRSWSRSILIDC
jgi:uncharacterized damage-inducible protein DinB